MSGVVAEARVCVAGGGVMGLWTAHHLAARGADVLIVERGLPGLEASAANAGTLAVQNKPLACVPLVVLSTRLWRALAEETGVDIEYETRGGLRVAHSVEDVETLERSAQAQRSAGAAVELIYQPDLSREAAYLDPTIRAASYCPDDGMANPLLATRALLAGCAKRNVRIWVNCPVVGIDAQGDDRFVVTTPRGQVRCQTFVAAAGVWTPRLLAMVGLRLPVRCEVQQVMTTDIAPFVFPHIVTHVRGNLTVKQSRASGKVLIGGGWKGDGDPDSGPARVRRDSMLGNLRWATQNVPSIATTRLLRAWAGFEGRTPDKMMVCGSVGSPRGFYVAGCAAGGFTLAPACGLLTAQLVFGETPAFVADPFLVKRFLAVKV